MKKNISFVMAFALLCILFIGTVVYATSTYSTVSISKNDNSKSSNSVGVSKSATFNAHNYASSSACLTMKAYACWTGWPYKCESSTTISPIGDYTYTEQQSKNSSFYIKLIGNKQCIGNGSVKAN